MKRFLLTLFTMLLFFDVSILFAANQRARVKLGNPNELTSYCIEGHVFVVAVGQSFGESTSYNPAIVQVYTSTRKGKVLPKRCKEKKVVKRRK